MIQTPDVKKIDKFDYIKVSAWKKTTMFKAKIRMKKWKTIICHLYPKRVNIHDIQMCTLQININNRLKLLGKQAKRYKQFTKHKINL